MLRSAALAAVAVTALAAADYRDVNKTVALTANGTVTIETHKGSIHVTTWDRPEVEVRARITAEPGEPIDRRRFEATQVLIDGGSDAVHIKTEYPEYSLCCWSDNGNNPEVDYNVRMPRAGRLSIHDHRSTTDISDLGGPLSIDTHRGTVRVIRQSGPVELTTHRGEANIDFAHFSGNNLIDTYRGSVELSLPRDSRFDVRGDLGRHADLQTDFPIMTRTAGRRGGSIQGTVNGGGSTLEVKTYRGTIRVHAL